MILNPEDCGCPFVDEGASIVNTGVCSGTLLFMVLLEGFLKGRCDIAEPCQRIEPPETLRESYDFIVVGAGAAGAIVAGRLSEKPHNVLLLEAGGNEPVGARVPSFYTAFWDNDELDWRYRTVPANYCMDQGEKGCQWMRGKGLGGCALINGMMYHRGHPADYDAWVDAGAEGWSWEENIQFFDMTEGNRQIGSLVSEKFHSRDGPLPVQQFNYQPPMVHDIIKAIDEAGLPVIKDMNDLSTPEGFAIAQAFNDKGQRYTTARAYLKPNSERHNLHVKTHAHVSRVVFEGRRAVGVEYIDNGTTKFVRATKEVILSAGALNTPHILMLSGIGAREHLEQFDIPVIADLAVGTNLKNHIGVTFYYTLENLNNTHTLDWANVVDYMLTREGPMSADGVTQLTGLLYSSRGDRGRDQPDLQFFFNGFYADCSKTGEVGEAKCPRNGYNISANAVSLLPLSTGVILLNSTDPLDPPIFDPNYFAHPADMDMVKDGSRHIKQIFDSPILSEKYGAKLTPEKSAACSHLEEWGEDWLECMIRLHTDPQNHQAGTAAMGRVVGPDLKVYHVDGLRVIDASAMPGLTTGNPQAAIMMIAERGAAAILRDHA